MFNYIENLTIFKFWLIFLFVERDGFIIKLEVAKVIRQHTFSLHNLISYTISFEIK